MNQQNPKNNTSNDIHFEDLDEDYKPTSFDKFCLILNKQHWIPLILFISALITYFLFNQLLGLYILSASLLLSGLIPLITGTYRSPIIGFLYGYKARLRALVTIVLGLFVLFVAFNYVNQGEKTQKPSPTKSIQSMR